MKKFLSLALVVAMLASSAALVACGDDSGDTTTKAPNNGATTTKAPADNKDDGATTTADKGNDNPGENPGENPGSTGETGEGGLSFEDLWNNWLALFRRVEEAEVENPEAFLQDPANLNLMVEGYLDAMDSEHTLTKGFDYTDDPDSDLGDEGGLNVLDQDTSTKWCGGRTDNEFNCAVVWAMTEAVKVTGYGIVSGNDNTDFTERNPIRWRLYACNELPEAKMWDINEELGEDYFSTMTVPEGWVLLDAVNAELPDDEYQSTLPDLNFYENVFQLSADKVGSYKYFMFLLDTNEDNCVQISELYLYGTLA